MRREMKLTLCIITMLLVLAWIIAIPEFGILAAAVFAIEWIYKKTKHIPVARIKKK